MFKEISKLKEQVSVLNEQLNNERRKSELFEKEIIRLKKTSNLKKVNWIEACEAMKKGYDCCPVNDMDMTIRIKEPDVYSLIPAKHITDITDVDFKGEFYVLD